MSRTIIVIVLIYSSIKKVYHIKNSFSINNGFHNFVNENSNHIKQKFKTVFFKFRSVILPQKQHQKRKNEETNHCWEKSFEKFAVFVVYMHLHFLDINWFTYTKQIMKQLKQDRKSTHSLTNCVKINNIRKISETFFTFLEIICWCWTVDIGSIIQEFLDFLIFLP